MNVTFDSIHEQGNTPEGLAFAYGYDMVTGTSYYGLVEVSEDEIIGKPRAYVTIPCKINLNNNIHTEFEENFISSILNNFSEAINN